MAMFLHPLNPEHTGNRILHYFFLNVLEVEGNIELRRCTSLISNFN